MDIENYKAFPLPSYEMDLMLQRWTSTAVAHPTSTSADELFEVRTVMGPERTAVAFEGELVSYAEIEACTSQLASGLQQRGGIAADSIVGLCMEKCVDEVVGMVGVMRAGAAYVPLDPKLPCMVSFTGVCQKEKSLILKWHGRGMTRAL